MSSPAFQVSAFKLISSGVDGRTSEEIHHLYEKTPSPGNGCDVLSNCRLDDDYVSLLTKFYNTTPEDLKVSSVEQRKEPVEVDLFGLFCPAECDNHENPCSIVPVCDLTPDAVRGMEENFVDSQKLVNISNVPSEVDIEVYCVSAEIHQEEVDDNEAEVSCDGCLLETNENPVSPEDNLCVESETKVEVKTESFTLRRVNHVSLNPKPLIVLKVLIEKSEVEAMLDSGASASLIRRSVAEKLPVVMDVTEQTTVYGYGYTSVSTLGVIVVPICVHGYVCLPLKLRVVDDELIDYDVYLGKEFLVSNNISLNPHRRKLRHVDRETGVQWDYYIRKPGDDNIDMIYSHIPCVSVADVVIDSNFPIEVPVTWNLPGFESSYICDSCLSRPSNWFYDGEIVSRSLINNIQGHPGIIDGKSGQLVVLVSRISPGEKKIKKGDVIGKLYTLVELTPKEQPNVNVIQGSNEREEPEFNLYDIELGSHLSENEKEAVYEMLNGVEGVFSKGDSDIGTATIGEHHIKLYDYTPIYQRPRRFPEPVSDEIEKQCQELNALDIIEPSSSPWSSPVVPVRKPDNSIRLCVDYRKLNKVTIQDRFPMPNLSDAVYSLHGVKYFTSLDLVKGYYQLKMAPEDKEYTAFSTAHGHWQFKRLPFGLCNAPASFQRQMQEILRDFPRHQVIVYIDDILILSKELRHHLELVRKVLKTLESHGIKIKPAKCSWFQQKVKFLGHMVSSSGISKLPSYMKRVEEYPKPETVRQLREFLGLINFQRKFAPHCGEIGKPLYSKTGGNGKKRLVWSEEMEKAFESLKELLCQDIELAFPDYSESASPLELYVDASGEGAGAYLSQQQNGEIRVIAFNSTSFNETQRRYSTIEKELVAIRWGVKSFKAFLYGQYFILHTDHQPLVYLHNMKMIDSRLARTLEDLSDFNFDIVYTPGKKNEAADALSRLYPQKLESQELNGQLPDGLKVIDLVPGGGDSMVHSLFIAYGHLIDSETSDLDIPFPDNVLTLRSQLVNYLSNNLERFGLKKNKDLNKRLKLMKLAGQLPIQEILLAFAELYHVYVYVYYGSSNPVIYKSSSTSGDRKIYLQCLAGIHYNPVRRTRQYREVVNSSVNCCVIQGVLENLNHPTQDDNLCEVIEAPLEIPENEDMLQSHVICNHSFADPDVRPVVLYERRYCALLDSGAEINLVSQSVIEENPNIEVELDNQENFKGLGSSDNPVSGIAKIPICLDEAVGFQTFPFAIVPDNMIHHCLLIGMNCLDQYDHEIGTDEKSYYKDIFCTSPEPYENPNLSSMFHVFSITLQTDFIPADTVLLNQKNDAEISRVIACLRRGLSKKELPNGLNHFKRSWKTLKLKDGCLFKVYAGVGVPVVSFNYLVDLVLRTHVDMAHIGTFKLYELLVKNLWHPMLRKVVKDACGSCSICQKNKPTAHIVIPPTLKIVTQAPFELMAIDLVSLPTVFQGFVGVLVLVDHFSKWLAVAPIRNKQAKTIVNLLEHQIFPSLLRLPFRILSDNGPEFNSIEFADLMERMNIHHIKTTAYKPSSNGAVERVNRTVIGFLRDLSTHPSDWNTYLPQAIRVYNSTVHKETGLSPASFLLTKEHPVTDQPILSRETRETWLEGHPQYVPFQVYQSVLKKIPVTGRLNVHKFGPKYDGPYEVVYVNPNGVTYELKNLHTHEIVRAHHIQLKPWREPPTYIVDHLKRFPLILNDVDCQVPESQLVNDVGLIGSHMYTRDPSSYKRVNEKVALNIIEESICNDSASGEEVSVVDINIPEGAHAVTFTKFADVNRSVFQCSLEEDDNYVPLVDDLLCSPNPTTGLEDPITPVRCNLLESSVPKILSQAPISPVKLRSYDKGPEDQKLRPTDSVTDDMDDVNSFVDNVANTVYTETADQLFIDVPGNVCTLSSLGNKVNNGNIDESFGMLPRPLAIRQDSHIIMQENMEKIENWSVSSIHEIESKEINLNFELQGKVDDTCIASISHVTQMSKEDIEYLESFITHVEEVISLSEDVVSMNREEINFDTERVNLSETGHVLGREAEPVNFYWLGIPDLSLDVSNVSPVVSNVRCKFSYSGDEILSDISKLFELSSESPMREFSGFSSPISKRAELKKRLDIIKKEVKDMRMFVLENRKASLERISRFSPVRIGEGVSSAVSPPFTRSRGRVMDLPLVQETILEYKD